MIRFTTSLEITSTFIDYTEGNTTSFYRNETFTVSVPTDEHMPTLLIYVSYVIVPLFFVLGVGGNILTLLVTRSRIYKYSSHGVYLRTMAINDTVFLLAFPFNKQFVHQLLGCDVRSLSVVGCKLYFALYRASRISAALFILQICIERFIVVWYPLKAKIISTKRATILLVCSTFIGTAAFTGAWTISANIGKGLCIPAVVTSSNKHILSAFSITGTILRTFLPAAMLLVFTPLTLVKLYSQRSVRRHMIRVRGTDETYRTTVMLLSVVIAFMILTMPFCLMKHILLFSGIDIVTSTLPWAKSMYEISQICEQTDCVVNFIIYVSASSTFRWHLTAMIKSRRTRNNPSIQISTVTMRDL